MDPLKAESLVAAMTIEQVAKYSGYWTRLQPRSHEEYHARWLFAFMSVHTTWQSNVRAFQLIRDRSWKDDPDKLEHLLKTSGVGLHKIRKRGVLKFDQEFWAAPHSWYKLPGETWAACRRRLSSRCHGIGPAKTAFVLEMSYPTTCEAVCLDAHMLKLYGESPKGKITPARYSAIETHWVGTCSAKGIPPTLARNIVWDQVQQKPDPEYWAHVLRNDDTPG